MATEKLAHNLLWWLLGSVFAVLTLAGAAWITAVHAGVKDVIATAAQHRERISVVEANAAGLRADIADVKASQRRTEDKLDRLLERVRP